MCERAAKLCAQMETCCSRRWPWKDVRLQLCKDSKPAGSKTAAKAQKFEGLKEEEKTAPHKDPDFFPEPQKEGNWWNFWRIIRYRFMPAWQLIMEKSGMKPQENPTVLTGRMDEPDICNFLKKVHPDLVIDATHPFARVVTENIKAACAETKMDYRCMRDGGGNKHTEKPKSESFIVGSVQEAADFLAQTKGKILITTGSKGTSCYQKHSGL